MKSRALFASLAAALLSLGCPSGEGKIGGVLVVSMVEVAPGITDIVVGATSQLSATPKTSSGIAVTGRNVTWSTSDPAVATVSTTGLVTGMQVGGPVRIRALVDGVTGDAVVTVRPVPVDHVTVIPAESGILVNSQKQLTARAFDAAGVELTGRSFAWNSSASGVAAVSSTGLVFGIAEGGPVTISATSEGKTGTATVSVSNRPPTRLGFLQPFPAQVTAGQPMNPSIRVALQDDFLVTVLGATNPVTIALAGNPGGATLTGTTTRAAVNGVATFNDLVLNRVGTSYTMLVTSPGLASATSNPFDVVAGTGNQLTFTTPPSSQAQSGVPLPQQPVLQLRDGSGNAVPQSGLVISVSITSGTGATLGGTLSATTNEAGTATFTNLKLTGTAGSYTLGFSASGVATLTSGTITLGAGPATQLFIATQPASGAQSGVPLSPQPAIQLRDALGNNVAQAGVVVTASIASGSGLLGGTTTATTNAAGLAAFSSLAINGSAGQYTLGFAAPGLQGATSASITLGAGAPTQLTITTQPSAAATSGVPFAQQPVVQLRDGGNNSVAVSGVQVTATVSVGGTLLGTVTQNTNSSGSVAFTDLAISGPAGSYTLTFLASGLTSATSSAIALGAGAATQLAITTQPSSSAQSGVAFAQQPVIQLRDASNNAVSQGGVVVTAVIASGGGTLGGTTTATTNASGAATFTNLQISGTVGNRTLSFTSGSLAGVTSNTITLTAGPASQLTITTQPSSTAQSGVAFPQQPVLQLRDAASNPVSQSGVVVTAAIATGGGTLGGILTATTNASGVATFTNLQISGTAGNRTLSFSASGLAGATSGTIALVAGPASQLSITTQPSSSAQSGVAFAQQPVLQLRDASNNAVSQSGVVVTAAINSGGGTLGGTVTATTSASGVATFTNLSITGTAGDRTLVFTASGLSNVVSGVITVTAGSASQLSITTQPSSSAQNAVAFAQQPVIQLRDAVGNPVSQSGVVVTASISTGGGSLGGTTTATTNSSGVASFTNLSITGTVGDRTLLFSASGFTSITSNTITITAGAASQLSITTQPSSSAQSGVAFAQQPVIQLRDVSGNAVSQSGVVVTAAIGSGGGTLGGALTATTNASGVATFTNLQISGTVGNRTLSFTSGSLTGATSTTITLTAGPASQLTITTQPSSTAQSGVAFPQQPVIQLRDASNNAVSQSGVAITAAIASGPGGSSLGGSTVVTTNASGAASYTNLSLIGPAGTYTLGFSSSGLTGATSGNVVVSAGTATRLGITTQPSASVQNGAVFPQQPVIQLRDNADNPVAQSGVVVTATINTGSGTLGGTTTATTNASGVATFTNLSITGTVGDRTLLFASAGLVSVASNTITVTAGAASKLGITTQPSSSAQSGVAFAQQPVIQVQDASGNAVSQSGTGVTAAIASGGGTLGGTLTATTNASGSASFTNLSISGTPGDRTLSFSAPGLTGATSGVITITGPPASQLSITTQPSSSAQSGVAFAQQPAIQLRDASNNAVSQSGVVVTAAIASGGGTLGGTLTATTDASGLATFTNLSISGTVGNRTLTFTSGSLTAATSNTITITAGAASKLGITTQPSSSAQSGVAFAQQPVIQVQDASGNPVSQSGTVVTAAIATGGGTLGGTLTATTNASGVATFTNLSITGSAGDRTLSFSATGLTTATSNTITINAGGATRLGITTQPSSSAQNGVAFAQQPVIQVQDPSGNPVSQSGTVVTASIASGGGTLGGTLTATTNASGVATFTNLSITGTIGDRTLSFTATGLTAATSNTITITAGAASKLGITTQPSSSAQSGVAFAQQPVLQIQDASGNPVSQSGTVVTAAIASGGGTLGGTLTATTNASGVASFTNLSITGTPGDRTLSFSAPSLTGATSNTITVGTGAASKLGITTQPSSSSQDGVAFAQQPVIQVQDASGNPVSQSGTVVTAAIASGGGTLGGTLTATTNSSGVASFTNLSITGTVGDRTLSFSATGLTGATSNTITITVGPPSQITYFTQPSSSATNGVAFATQPVMLVRDVGNNNVSGAVVTAAISTAPAGTSSLNGTPTATTASNGRASFTNLAIVGPVGNYKLQFSVNSGAVTSAETNTIALSAGAAAIIVANSATSQSKTVAMPVDAPPSVKVMDTGGNPIQSVSVTFTVTAGGGTTVPASPATLSTNSSGVASLTSWILGPTAGTNTVTATSTGLSGSPVTFNATGTAGSPSQMSITQQPSSSATSGVVFPQQPIVQVKDANNNPVSGVSVSVGIQTGVGGTLGGTLTKVTDASGNATFTDLSITGLLAYTLRFSATGPPSVDSGSITVLP